MAKEGRFESFDALYSNLPGVAFGMIQTTDPKLWICWDLVLEKNRLGKNEKRLNATRERGT
jgi:hypothetical protein